MRQKVSRNAVSLSQGSTEIVGKRAKHRIVVFMIANRRLSEAVRGWFVVRCHVTEVDVAGHGGKTRGCF
jgi:hypothetical protein